MNNFFDDRRAKVESFKKDFRRKKASGEKTNVPEGLFVKCESCQQLIYHEDLIDQLFVCPHCRYHFRITARKRIALTCDTDSFTELFSELRSKNPLDFPEYEEKIAKYQQETNEYDAFVCGVAKIDSLSCAIGVLDSFFMMGSMGSAVGEKVTNLIEYAIQNHLPVVIFSASGGARMQEGIFSLMQMAKTSAAVRMLHDAKLLYVSVLTHPTTGGVAASFAFLGDVIVAEHNALIGFAGQRVIKQTIKQDLPAGFQTAPFQLEKGFVDMMAERKDIKQLLATLLRLHEVGEVV